MRDWLVRSLLVGLLLLAVVDSRLFASENGGLQPHSARYELRRGPLKGELVQTLSRISRGFRAETTMRTKGLARIFARGELIERSWFEDLGDGPLPYRYESTDSLSSHPGTVSMSIDWATGTLTGKEEGQAFEMNLDGPTWDHVSLQYALIHDLSTGKRRSHYAMVDPGRNRRLEVKYLPTTQVTVPAGTFSVEGVRHQATGSKRMTTLWLAPALNYLPVVIEQHKGDKRVVRAELAEFQPGETTGPTPIPAPSGMATSAGGS